MDQTIKITCVAHDFPPTSKSLEISNKQPGSLDNNKVRVRVHYACMNFADVLMLGNKYQVKLPTPFVPGMEVAGQIEQVGQNVKNMNVGACVIVLGGSNGWQTYIDVTPKECIPFSKTTVPDHVMRQAASLIVGYSTSHVALYHERYGNLKSSDTVLVLGASGGVGLAAVQLAKLKKCTVIGCASSDEKCQTVSKVGGADHVINYSEKDWFKQVLKITNGKGVNVIYDPVGGDFTTQSLKCIAWGGKLLTIGYASGPIPSIPANILLVKNCAVIGVYWGSHMQKEPKTIMEYVFSF